MEPERKVHACKVVVEACARLRNGDDPLGNLRPPPGCSACGGNTHRPASEWTGAAATKRCNQLIRHTNWDPNPTRQAQATASRDRHLPRTNCTVLTHTDEHTECTVDSAVRSDAPPQTEVSITERLYAVRVKVTLHS